MSLLLFFFPLFLLKSKVLSIEKREGKTLFKLTKNVER